MQILNKEFGASQDQPKSRRSGLHCEAPAMLGSILSTVLHRVWPRTDQAHVTFQDVAKLRHSSRLYAWSAEISWRCNPKLSPTLSGSQDARVAKRWTMRSRRFASVKPLAERRCRR